MICKTIAMLCKRMYLRNTPDTSNKNKDIQTHSDIFKIFDNRILNLYSTP
jgi:hypothetical protein